MKTEKTLKTPAPLKTINKVKILYLCDSAMIGNYDEAQEEARGIQLEFWDYFGVSPEIEIAKSHADVFDSEKVYDILMFDYGGIGSYGASGLMDSLCRRILQLSDDKPSRFFIMASKMTGWAMQDMIESMPERAANVFLDMRFAKPYLDSLLEEKGIVVPEI
ncbi:hypothetical protein [uncultured Desulfuromusa sp.]|uniref:hypothetical protein n=1 Tax=uncultured Desulfuromusa sp. TaxID=219183 RepID=UPI002AA74146|nr:hypothetical protein [uncultured Desulfuromusa sp.]